MFEELIDEKDLEYTENRLRVHVMSLKKSGDAESLFRLYGVLALILARRGNILAAQDALNDAEFLLVENRWRGTQKEIWCHYDRALVLNQLGRPELSLKNLEKAESMLCEDRDSELKEAIASAKQAVSASLG